MQRLFKILKNIVVLPVTWLFLILLSFVLYVLSYLPRAFSKNYYRWLTRFWCKIVVRALDVDLKLINKNSRPLPEQFILVANHPSAMEDFAVPALFDIYPLAKAGVRKWMVLGRISDYAGSIYVKRDSANSRHAAKQSLIDAVQAGKNIAIFPEGGCRGSRIYEKFHTGAFDISLQTGVVIVPVFLHYIDQKTFEWKDQSLVKKLWQIFKGNNNLVNYYVHDAISPKNFNDKDNYTKHVHAKFLQWQNEYLDKTDIK